MGVDKQATRIYGYILIGCAILSTWALMHHPVLPAHGSGSLVDAVSSVRAQSVSVHAAAIAFGMIELICFCGFAMMLGLGRPLALGGLVAWSVGTFALITAAAINGFAVPSLAARMSQSPEQAEAFSSLLQFAWSLNQAWDRIGLLSWAAAVCSWSLLLATGPGWPRLLGIAGALFGAGMVTAISGSWISMDARGFVLATSVFGLWTIGIGVLMVTGGYKRDLQPNEG